MFLNYFKTAIRHIRRNPFFSLINIIGLAIGIAVSFVVYFKLQYDLSFNKFVPEGNQLYRVIKHLTFGSDTYVDPLSPLPLASAIKRMGTKIEEVVPLQKYYPDVTTINSPQGTKLKVFKKKEQIIFTNKSYFKTIPYQWLVGSPDAFDNPDILVLTEKEATKFFPNTPFNDIIGNTITFDSSITVSVGGIVKDQNKNTDFNFTSFISLSTIPVHHELKTKLSWDQWHATRAQIIIKLLPNTKPENIESLLNQISKEHHTKSYHPIYTYTLQPLSEVHFTPDLWGINAHTVNKRVLYILVSIALFLLLLATFNYINLTTAQSFLRAKEIGIRKTVGGSRKQLILQFYTETFLITLTSALISLILLPYFFSLFSGFFPEAAHFDLDDHNHFYIFFIAFILIITLLSGWYPALLSSRFKAVTMLRDAVPTGGSRKAGFRKVLITLQFIIAQIFIISTMFMVKQTHFLLNKDLGFNKDAVVYFSVPREYRKKELNKRYQQKADHLLKEIKNIPGIKRVSLADNPPSTGSTGLLLQIKQNQKIDTINVTEIYADSNYLKIYDFRLLAGSFDLNKPFSYLINETLLKKMGYKKPSDAIGKPLGNFSGTIIGVISDFNNGPLRKKIEPIYIHNFSWPGRIFSILLKPQSPGNNTWEHTIDNIHKKWDATYPNQELNLRFLDRVIASFYTREQQMLKLLYWLTAIAIIISMLGLFGLVTYITNQRTKEIGIRKILGAPLAGIVYILSKEFILLVFLSMVISLPVTLILVNKYFEQYVYYTKVSWWVFFLGFLVMLLITLLTLSIKVLQRAKANPVKNLRSE